MKSNRLKMIVAVLLCILSAVGLGAAAHLFLIGEPVDGKQLSCIGSVDNGQTLNLRVTAVESGVALRDWKFQQDGNTLSISARKVLVSPLFSDGSFQFSIDLNSVEKILLGGRTIWSGRH